MADDATSEPTATTAGPSAPRCPWCSAELPSADAAECPSCKATLVSTGDAAVPGVTAIDVEAMLRARREPPKQRGGILGWISGEAAEEAPTPSDMKSFEAPSLDVRREMLRLEIDAERQRLEAEAAALALEGKLSGGSSEQTSEVDAEDGAEPTGASPDADGQVPTEASAPPTDSGSVEGSTAGKDAAAS